MTLKIWGNIIICSERLMFSCQQMFSRFQKYMQILLWIRSLSFFTSPGLSWDAMLKMTDVKLNLIADTDMYQFIEERIKGGVSYRAQG